MSGWVAELINNRPGWERKERTTRIKDQEREKRRKEGARKEGKKLSQGKTRREEILDRGEEGWIIHAEIMNTCRISEKVTGALGREKGRNPDCGIN